MTQDTHTDQRVATKIAAGTKIITENEISQKMYVIVKGKARVFKLYLGQRITLAVLGDGEIFGEMSFLDGQPRSASVEALSDMDVMVVDGAKGSEQMKNLPSWVWSIFRTVFYRFRELDREITSLRSVVDYRKKGMKEDIIASTIYLELTRFIKTCLLVTQQRLQDKVKSNRLSVFQEIDGILGTKAISLKSFWKHLQDYDFMDGAVLRERDEVVFFEQRMYDFDEFLNQEMKLERYLILSHGALSVLRAMIGYLSTNNAHKDLPQILPLTYAELNLHLIPNNEAAVKELESCQIVAARDQVFTVNTDTLHKLYMYLSIIKSFDFTNPYAD